MKSASVIMSRTEATMCLPQIFTYMQLWRKNGGTKGYKGSTIVAAMVGEKAYLGTKWRWLVKKSKSAALAILELCFGISKSVGQLVGQSVS